MKLTGKTFGKNIKLGTMTGGAMLLSVLLTAPVTGSVSAQAASQPMSYQANLTSLNGSGTSGTATVTVTGNTATVTVQTNGASANLVHGQLITLGGTNQCPTPAADTDKDSYVSTTEAKKTIGDIKIALTTTGDVSPNSLLAADRFPKADAKGTIAYTRSFTLPSGITAADLGKAVVVQHGVAKLFDDKAKYDGTKRSDLDNKLAYEITAVATCGKLTAMPSGGAATGVGSVNGIESPALLMAGAVALAGAAVAGLYARREYARSK